MISITEWLFLFLIYSFAGWILETVLGTIQQKRFTNKFAAPQQSIVKIGFILNVRRATKAATKIKTPAQFTEARAATLP